MTTEKKELENKVLSAGSAEEVIEIVSAAYGSISLEEAEHLYAVAQESKKHRGLSLDEMEAVSGGADRNWLKDGCAATVEAGSWCLSNDSCHIWSVTYTNEPSADAVCPRCNTKTMYISSRYSEPTMKGIETYYTYTCKICGTVKQDY